LGKQKQQQLVYQMQACQQPQPPLTSTTPSSEIACAVSAASG
jgi:hypothetical protein